MPGIVGLITRMPRQEAERQLRQMVGALCHETFYQAGMWIDEFMGVYVGWVARKGSFCDGMPVFNEDRSVALVFAGEEYAEPGTAQRLRQRGHKLDTQPACTLVHIYEDDPSFPASLNGRFHGLLVDRSRNTALLFNDRYGMHRLYYHESAEAFYFAAEAKAILEVCPGRRQIDPSSMGELVSHGCVLENRTLFDDVHVLPQGANWLFENASVVRKGTYFQPKEWEEQGASDPEDSYTELRETFRRNLPRYFSGPERIGMSVTGGLDTRMILAGRKFAPGELPCYSFGGTYRDSQDVLLGRRVAESCEQSHEVILVGSEFLQRFPHYAERTVYLSDGCVDVRHSPDLFINERAREIAPVRMTGNYGGEVLREVRAFKPVEPSAGIYCREFLSHIRAAKVTYEKISQGHPVAFAVFRQAPWHHYGLLALEQTQLTLRSPFLDNDLVRAVFRAPRSSLKNPDVSLRLIADGNPALGMIRTDRGLGGNRGRFSYAALQRVLDFTVKAEYAYDYGMPQWMTRIDHLLSAFRLERMFLGRHKFYHFRVWYRDFLSKYIREVLLDPRTLSRPYLVRSALEKIVQSHLRGEQNHTNAIHQVLTLELFHRLFIDSQSSGHSRLASLRGEAALLHPSETCATSA